MIDADIVTATHAPPAAIAERQRQRWSALLRAAAQGSAWFRRALGGRDPATTPLQAMAPTDKSTMMRHFDEWVSDPRLDLDALRAFVADPRRVAEPWLGRYAVWESSGSTGEPTIFVQDEQALAVYDALEAVRRSSPRPWQRWFDPFYLSERVAFVGAVDGHFASEVSMRRLRSAQPWRAGTWRSFSILQPTAELVAELNAFAPTVIATYPTAAALLAREARAGRLRVHVQEVWTGGETLTHAMRALVERPLGAVLRNSYGASEFLPIAWECGHGALHVNADWVILEGVDAHGGAVPAGTLSHTALLTNLANHVQPIIRLDIGDRIRQSVAACPCGCPLPTIDVEGRDDEALTLAGRDGGEDVTLLPLALVGALEDEAGVTAFRLEQTGPCSLRLDLGPGAGDEAPQRCRAALRALIRKMGAATPRLRVREVASLPVGRSGKRQRIQAHRPPQAD